ncbi:MAG: GspH/FimT family pseudopilin [Pseudomonadota bacterium]
MTNATPPSGTSGSKPLRPAAVGGFTLVELLVTITIVGILATIAVPNFWVMVQNTRISTMSTDLTLALQYAKSEAVKRNVRVYLCANNDADTDCPGAGAGWSNGWRVQTGNCEDDAVGATALRKWDPSSGVNVCYGAGQTDITFLGTGFTSGDMGTYAICDNRGPTSAKGVILTLQGRTRAATDSNDADTIKEDGSGTNLSCP